MFNIYRFWEAYDVVEIKGNWIGKKKLRGLSPQANYTDRATAARRRI
jgi:hypothetical protein